MDDVYAVERAAIQRAADHLQGAFLMMPNIIMKSSAFEKKLGPVLVYLSAYLEVKVTLRAPTPSHHGHIEIRTRNLAASFILNRDTGLLRRRIT